MRDIKAFLIENGFERCEGVFVHRVNGLIEVFRPCGKHTPQPFRCRNPQTLPVAILKQRPSRSKAIGTLVLLEDENAYYRRGGVNERERSVFEELKVPINKHVRGPAEAGYVVT